MKELLEKLQELSKRDYTTIEIAYHKDGDIKYTLYMHGQGFKSFKTIEDTAEYVQELVNEGIGEHQLAVAEKAFADAEAEVVKTRAELAEKKKNVEVEATNGIS